MATIHTSVRSIHNPCLCISIVHEKVHCCNINNHVTLARKVDIKNKIKDRITRNCLADNRVIGARVCSNSRSWRLSAATVVENYGSKDSNVQNQTPFIEIPVTCYQILGVPDQSEKDEIVKSVMHLKSAEIEEGYTEDAVISRQNLLMDVRDKLLFEPEYAGNIKEKQPPKSSLRIPWAWLPGALSLLQEVGEEKLVLDIGRRALQLPQSKPFIHDLLLSMALAECAIAKLGFEKNYISQGFEALARAQCLLRSKISLGKMKLLSQIEESLEDLAPACTLEILGLPHTPENAERRLGAIAALRELLRQGLDVETSCQVQDWPCFLNQALNKLMATEIVELIPWDNLALIRKNRKSLESQNQRVVVDFNSFYMVLIAHIALGFSSKQTDLISKAIVICECLTASEGIDMKFEEALCLFLLGQGDEATAAERLWQLERNTNSSSKSSLPRQETRETPSARKSLETWLKDAVLGLFQDTRDCSPSLANFFDAEKRASPNRYNKRAPQSVSNVRHRPLTHALPSDQRTSEESISCIESSRHLGPVVKPLTPNLQSPIIEGKANDGSNTGLPSMQLKRNLGSRQNEVWQILLPPTDVVGKLIFVTALGCIMFVLFNLINMRFWKMENGYRLQIYKPEMESTLSHTWDVDSTKDSSRGRASMSENNIVKKFMKLFSMLKMQLKDHPEAADLRTASLAAGLSSRGTSVFRQPMPKEEAESLLKQWQAIKAEALGPNHDVQGLVEVLDGSMLLQWQALADAAKAKSCFWRFVLLQLTVLQADIVKDGMKEMAELEVLLEEAAELVDESQPKNPTYYSTYKIHYLLKRHEDGFWRFCEGDVQTPA